MLCVDPRSLGIGDWGLATGDWRIGGVSEGVHVGGGSSRVCTCNSIMRYIVDFVMAKFNGAGAKGVRWWCGGRCMRTGRTHEIYTSSSMSKSS